MRDASLIVSSNGGGSALARPAVKTIWRRCYHKNGNSSVGVCTIARPAVGVCAIAMQRNRNRNAAQSQCSAIAMQRNRQKGSDTVGVCVNCQTRSRRRRNRKTHSWRNRKKSSGAFGVCAITITCGAIERPVGGSGAAVGVSEPLQDPQSVSAQMQDHFAAAQSKEKQWHIWCQRNRKTRSQRRRSHKTSWQQCSATARPVVGGGAIARAVDGVAITRKATAQQSVSAQSQDPQSVGIARPIGSSAAQ